MKKICSFLLILCLTVSLTGCGGTAPDASDKTVEMPLVPLTPAEEITYEVVTDLYSQTVYSDDGETLLMTISLALPHLQAYANGVLIEEAATAAQTEALLRTETFNDTFAQWKDAQTTASYINDIREWYAVSPEAFADGCGSYFGEEFVFSSYRAGSVLSISATYYSYLGGAHPNTVYFSWNFDLESGTFLTIPELAADPQAFTLAVADMIEAQAVERFRDPDNGYGGLTISDIYWSDYREIMEKWGSDYAACFDSEGLTVTFSAYDLAAYAAGPQEFHFPYTTLDSYWSDSGRAVLGLD